VSPFLKWFTRLVLALLFGLLCLSLCSLAGAASLYTPRRWTIRTDLADGSSQDWRIPRGGYTMFEATFKNYGDAVDLSDATDVRLQYRTDDMAADTYYYATGYVHNATSGVVRIPFGPGDQTADTNYIYTIAVSTDADPMLEAGGRIRLTGTVTGASTNTPATVTGLIADHVAATDPHGDRAYTDAQIVAEVPTVVSNSLAAMTLLTSNQVVGIVAATAAADRVYSDTSIASTSAADRVYSDAQDDSHSTADRTYTDNAVGSHAEDQAAHHSRYTDVEAVIAGEAHGFITQTDADTRYVNTGEQVAASSVSVVTAGFGEILSPSDDDVQTALDTLNTHDHDGDYATPAQGTSADTAYGWGDHSTNSYATNIYIVAAGDNVTVTPSTNGNEITYTVASTGGGGGGGGYTDMLAGFDGWKLGTFTDRESYAVDSAQIVYIKWDDTADQVTAYARSSTGPSPSTTITYVSRWWVDSTDGTAVHGPEIDGTAYKFTNSITANTSSASELFTNIITATLSGVVPLRWHSYGSEGTAIGDVFGHLERLEVGQQ